MGTVTQAAGPRSERPGRATAEQFRGFPGGRVDPREARPDELLALGLPPPPERPALHAVWTRVLGRQIEMRTFLEAEHLAGDVRPQLIDRPSFSATRYQTSRNWSGATIAANADLSLVQVWGIWRLPKLGVVPACPAGAPTALSMWVGLDGQRRYFGSSLPQIGTSVSVDASGNTNYQAWTQWWSRESADTLPVPLTDFPLGPGDRVAGAVTVVDSVTVLLLLLNLSVSPPLGMAVLGHSPPVTRAGGLVQQPRITGASAEWILERPAIPHSDDLACFPPYLPTQFEFCGAAAGRTVDLAGALGGHDRDLLDARLIRMFERRHGPDRTALISMPGLVDRTRLGLHHGGFSG